VAPQRGLVGAGRGRHRRELHRSRSFRAAQEGRHLGRRSAVTWAAQAAASFTASAWGLRLTSLQRTPSIPHRCPFLQGGLPVRRLLRGIRKPIEACSEHRGDSSDTPLGGHLKHDAVLVGGSSFMALRDDPGPCPGRGWQLLAAAGRDGKQGATGPQGERGLFGPPRRTRADDNQLACRSCELRCSQMGKRVRRSNCGGSLSNLLSMQSSRVFSPNCSQAIGVFGDLAGRPSRKTRRTFPRLLRSRPLATFSRLLPD